MCARIVSDSFSIDVVVCKKYFSRKYSLVRLRVLGGKSCGRITMEKVNYFGLGQFVNVVLTIKCS